MYLPHILVTETLDMDCALFGISMLSQCLHTPTHSNYMHRINIALDVLKVSSGVYGNSSGVYGNACAAQPGLEHKHGGEP